MIHEFSEITDADFGPISTAASQNIELNEGLEWETFLLWITFQNLHYMMLPKLDLLFDWIFEEFLQIQGFTRVFFIVFFVWEVCCHDKVLLYVREIIQDNILLLDDEELVNQLFECAIAALDSLFKGK